MCAIGFVRKKVNERKIRRQGGNYINVYYLRSEDLMFYARFYYTCILDINGYILL